MNENLTNNYLIDDPLLCIQLQNEFNKIDSTLQLHGFSKIGDIISFPKQSIPRLIDTLREILMNREKESSVKQEYIYKIRSLEHEISGFDQKLEYSYKNIQLLNDEIINLKKKFDDEKSNLKSKLLENEKLVIKLSSRERGYQNDILKKQNELNRLSEQYRKVLENGSISVKKLLEPKTFIQVDNRIDSNPFIQEMINNYSSKIDEITQENDKLKEILCHINDKLIEAVSIKGSSFKENYKLIFGESAFNDMFKNNKSILNPTIFQINLLKVNFKANFKEFVESLEKNFKKLIEFLNQAEEFKEFSSSNSNNKIDNKNLMPGLYNTLTDIIEFYKYISNNQMELIKNLLYQMNFKEQEITSIFSRNLCENKNILYELQKFLNLGQRIYCSIQTKLKNDYLNNNHLVQNNFEDCEYEDFLLKCHHDNKVKINQELDDYNNFLNGVTEFCNQIPSEITK